MKAVALNRRGFLARTIGLAAGTSVLAAPVLSQRQVLRFGLTPVFLSNDLGLLSGLETYLTQSTGYRVELIKKRTYQEITTLLVTGQLDAAWICGYPYVQFQNSLELLSIPIWRGKPTYQAYLIGALGREASEIDDLRGDLHCFSDPDSNSGYLVTSALLADRNTQPNEFFRNSFFAYGHRNVVRAVASGLAQSGSVDGYVWDVLSHTEPKLTRRTKVIWRSDWLGFPPLAAPKTLAGTEMFRVVKLAFLSMHGDPLGLEILGLLKLDRFGQPDETSYYRIAEMARKVRNRR